MPTTQQINDWLTLTEKSMESKAARAENNLIKQIWDKELQEFKEWKTQITKTK